MKIRKATKKDIKGLLELESELIIHLKKLDSELDVKKCRESFTKKYREQFKKNKKDWFVLVAEEKDKIIGFVEIWLKKSDFIGEKYTALIGNIFVKEKYRNKGTASQLIKEATAILKKRKVRSISIQSDIKNTLAIKTWKSLGFKEYEIQMRIKI